MRWILFLFSIFPILSTHLYFQAYGAHLEITDLNDNPGIVALKVGNTFIREGYDWLVHTFKLDTFQEILNQYDIMISQINSNVNMKDFKDILKMKFIQTSLTLQKLSPRRKTKRAINILGTLIKTITGNLDNDDLVTLNQKISYLHYSNKDLIMNNNEQIKINNQFQDRINNLTKVGVLSKSILQATEINYIIDKLENSGISVNSDEQVYEFLEPAAFYNGSCIVFLIKIPKFLQGIYQQIIVENIPINEEKIPIDFTHAVLGTNVTFVMNDTCVNIEQNIICKLQAMKNVSNDMCIHRLLRGNPSSCPFKKYNGIHEVKSMGNGKILIRNAKAVQLKNSCGYGPKNLTGSFLITFRNCSVEIENQSFENTQLDYSNILEMLPLQSTLINKSKTIVTDTQILQQLHTNSRKRIEVLETNNHHVSYGGTFTVIILLIITGYLFKEIRTIWTKIVIKPSKPTDTNIELNRDGSS
ncbi:uncharacterized protein LOC129716857 isoform X2 [Wyeomyia smithii]|nr:uncharacterized protein LOC129716857 isoform X2 [Wyeomyia smithii]